MTCFAKPWFLPAVWLLLCGPMSLPSTGDELRQNQTMQKQVERLSQPYLDADVVTGVSIGVIRGNDEATVHLGTTNLRGDVANDETIYEIGSVSKVFTGLLLASLATGGEIDVNDPAQSLLPDGVRMPQWKDTPIRLKHLSTHVSGLPPVPDNMPFGDPNNPYGDYPSALAYKFLNGHSLRRAPGTKSEYSNFAVGLLGHLLCLKASQTYDELLDARLCEPLGMKDTKVSLSDAMRGRLATPHIGEGVPGHKWDFADMPGAGGIHSSLADMMRFAQANLNPPDATVGRAMELAWQQHREGDAKEFAMGLGWHIARDGQTRWHNGQTGGYHAMIMVNRQVQVAVVLLCNTATMEVDRLAEDTVRWLSGAKVEPREFKKSLQVSNEVMQRYVGRYQLAPGFVFTVTVKDDKLMVGLTNQPTLQVFADSETQWKYRVVDATLTFKVDDTGNCNALELLQNGVLQTAPRID